MPAVALRPPCGSACMLPDGASVGAVPFPVRSVVRRLRGWRWVPQRILLRTHALLSRSRRSPRSAVVGKGRPSAQCSVVLYFASGQYLGMKQTFHYVRVWAAPPRGMAPRCTMWKVPCAVGIHGPAWRVPRAVILPLTRPAWSGPGTNLLQVCTVRCEGLPGAALQGQRMWERSGRTLTSRFRCCRRMRNLHGGPVVRCPVSAVACEVVWRLPSLGVGMVFRSSRPRRPFRFPVRYVRVHSLAARLHAGVMVGALCLGLGVVTAVCLVHHWMSARCRVRPPVPSAAAAARVDDAWNQSVRACRTVLWFATRFVAVKMAVETARAWDQRLWVAKQGMTMCFNQLSHACWIACGTDRLGSVSASVLLIVWAIASI